MTIETKRCFKCHRQLKLSEFYKHKEMADGHLNKCKSCTKRDVRSRYRNRWKTDPMFVEQQRLRGRDKYKRLYRGQINLPGSHPRRKANTMVNNAVRDGRLVKPTTCTECGESGRIEGHHENYNKPLNVHWLCSRCHGLYRRYA